MWRSRLFVSHVDGVKFTLFALMRLCLWRTTIWVANVPMHLKALPFTLALYLCVPDARMSHSFGGGEDQMSPNPTGSHKPWHHHRCTQIHVQIKMPAALSPLTLPSLPPGEELIQLIHCKHQGTRSCDRYLTHFFFLVSSDFVYNVTIIDWRWLQLFTTPHPPLPNEEKKTAEFISELHPPFQPHIKQRLLARVPRTAPTAETRSLC